MGRETVNAVVAYHGETYDLPEALENIDDKFSLSSLLGRNSFHRGYLHFSALVGGRTLFLAFCKARDLFAGW
jgi:hypothetical protein